ncbi:cobalamin-independent methionine synthase II family protein [Paeniglutamicibacter psychrophenolicus]|uniref:cobalamin-independent methionine synthase II family protein n=1 Tax=Paeniglutamicibacter psychrophenolicus TaxID=257454 RepID=UPI00278B7262|nr:cobalamin-independent methionine synthase II family protein [Paeniglutamicibacter psychrophenolicus]MDQ0094125.1 5-methyltetrahydropteroyltriglutamate--homocysteine methyltransferase [Paeniglutamicibacter psychrophenolicus]
MSLNTSHIRTTHAGSLPRTDALLAANEARERDGVSEKFLELLETSVTGIVARQRELGIDIPNDGEFGHTMSSAVDFGAWWNYSFARLGGLQETIVDRWAETTVNRSSPGNVVLTSFPDRRDRRAFAEAYADPASGILAHRKATTQPKVVAPLTYIGHDLVASDIRNLKTAMAATGTEEGFLAALSPASCARLANDFYASDEEYLFAAADAMREEYKAILDAGLILQIDDPSLAESWDQINPEPSLEDYLKFLELRVEATNHALRGLPAERIRLHVCWGSWHGPHTTDIPFADILDPVLRINANMVSFEAGNVRHEHEWRIWEDRALPEGKILVPGVVSHATNVVEHPELVADRIERFANLVGRENVIASTDCGLGGRVHPQIAMAKLEALGAGAALATQRLWKGAEVIA